MNKKRLTGVIAIQSTLYAASITGLYFAWYKDYPQSGFHFFNDNGEWLQMDKCGHVTAAYYISRIGYDSYKWCGVNENKSAWFGALLGFAYMLNIEILDGFSKGWGFSAGDLAANTLGSAIFLTQQLTWHQQKIVMKFSAHTTDYALQRPDILGSNLTLRLLKDYNGQSYWVSGNIKSFMPADVKFPGWLNVALGYGAEGMTGATGDDTAQPGVNSNGQPCRRFFISLDVDLSRIPVKSTILKSLFKVVNFIKIPAPAIEYNTKGDLKFHGLYY